jgi:hypothetical protein
VNTKSGREPQVTIENLVKMLATRTVENPVTKRMQRIDVMALFLVRKSPGPRPARILSLSQSEARNREGYSSLLAQEGQGDRSFSVYRNVHEKLKSGKNVLTTPP